MLQNAGNNDGMEAPMINDQQKEAVQDGQPVPFDVDGLACVILRKDVYEKLANLADDGADVRGTYSATMRAWDEEPDPALPLYQQFRRRP
jgi:hypothetical protein